METIFDHNPTEKEMKRFQGLQHPKIKEIYLNGHADNHYYDLGILFSMRGDKGKANEYWSKIKKRSMLDTLIEDF